MGPSFADLVVMTSEFGGDWNVVRLVFPDEVCGDVLVLLMLSMLGGWNCAAFAE